MKIPSEVTTILDQLKKAGFEAYVVGGCVRDLIMGTMPKDWDITTNAKPEEIQELFKDSFYENQFGTVGVKTGSEVGALSVVEVTTFRTESRYSDKRHPDEVKFADRLQDDLKRRDFTINALALSYKSDRDTEIIDNYGGQDDIKNRTIKAVGRADERFGEDALRMLRAIRFAATLGFTIEEKTLEAIEKNHEKLEAISKERIKDELIKLVDGPFAHDGIELLKNTGLLKFIMPELLEGVDVEQNHHHIYSVWEHNVRALKYTVEKRYSTTVRLASLLHDVGKPRSKRGPGRDSTFYGHEVIGARMTAKLLERLKFSKEMVDKITKLVRYHLFYYNVGEVTESSVRRLVANIGKENVEDLLKVREADRIGSGTPKAVPYKLRHMKFMIDKVARDPISAKMLKINGNDIMELLKLEQGPKIGMIMNALMEEVLDAPKKNVEKYLRDRTKILNKISEVELTELAKRGQEKSAEVEEKQVGEIKEKHHVE